MDEARLKLFMPRRVGGVAFAPKAWSLKRCTPGLSIRTTLGRSFHRDGLPGAGFLTHGWLCSGTRNPALSSAIISRPPGNRGIELILASDSGKPMPRLGGNGGESAMARPLVKARSQRRHPVQHNASGLQESSPSLCSPAGRLLSFFFVPASHDQSCFAGISLRHAPISLSSKGPTRLASISHPRRRNWGDAGRG